MDTLRQTPSKDSGVHAPFRGCDVGPDAAARELNRPVSLWMACPPWTGQPLEWASRADEPLGGQSVPRGNREHADKVILKLREAELELSRSKSLPEAAWIGEGRGDFVSRPFRAISRQAGRDLSLTCLVSGLDLACRGLVWLDFVVLVEGQRCRRRGPGTFRTCFPSCSRWDSPRGVVDLENRQR